MQDEIKIFKELHFVYIVKSFCVRKKQKGMLR